MIDKTKEDIVKSVARETSLTQAAVKEAYECIFESLHLENINIQQFLQGKFITKFSINDLHESFVGNQIPSVNLKVMPVPTL